jgi:hypothetical protein
MSGNEDHRRCDAQCCRSARRCGFALKLAVMDACKMPSVLSVAKGARPNARELRPNKRAAAVKTESQ